MSTGTSGGISSSGSNCIISGNSLVGAPGSVPLNVGVGISASGSGNFVTGNRIWGGRISISGSGSTETNNSVAVI